ncbi:MAG TPA: SGNH/GDSL hydrolase family protein [Vicinamibacterales bacterium]|nr:SGNH/GDSL hydrolase family protein [Vicinamibacterales bacterium]
MRPSSLAGIALLLVLLLQSSALIAQQGLGGAAPPLPAALLECADFTAALRAVADQDTRLRDWANLARYREANHTAGRPDVVFMGDSLTDFWQQPRSGGFFPGKNYANRGVSSQTTPQMLVRFRHDVIALKPKVVVILAGANDLAGNTGPATDAEIQGNLASMAELAKAHGIRVVLASITPVSGYHVAPPPVIPQLTRRPLARIRAINDWMKAYATANNHVYLDYYSAMVDASGMLNTEFSTDDFHPNAAGYAVMAPLAEAAIARVLK